MTVNELIEHLQSLTEAEKEFYVLTRNRKGRMVNTGGIEMESLEGPEPKVGWLCLSVSDATADPQEE